MNLKKFLLLCPLIVIIDEPIYAIEQKKVDYTLRDKVLMASGATIGLIAWSVVLIACTRKVCQRRDYQTYVTVDHPAPAVIPIVYSVTGPQVVATEDEKALACATSFKELNILAKKHTLFNSPAYIAVFLKLGNDNSSVIRYEIAKVMRNATSNQELDDIYANFILNNNKTGILADRYLQTLYMRLKFSDEEPNNLKFIVNLVQELNDEESQIELVYIKDALDEVTDLGEVERLSALFRKVCRGNAMYMNLYTLCHNRTQVLQKERDALEDLKHKMRIARTVAGLNALKTANQAIWDKDKELEEMYIKVRSDLVLFESMTSKKTYDQ